MKLNNQNVLFIARTMGLGGTENVVLQLCEILSGKVNKIVVCSSGGVHEKKLCKMGIKHHTIPDIASKRPSDMVGCYKKIRSVIKEELITVVHSHHRMAAFYTELTAPKNVIKIVNAHNTFQDKKKLTRFAYRDTRLIAVGEMVKKNLTDYFEIPVDQVSVIHNAIKAFDGSIEPIDILKDEHAKGKVLIGNIGRLSEQKGMRYFLDAAAITITTHPEAFFVIVGDGELKAQLEEKVTQLDLENNVLFLGYRSDIQNVMSQLDFVVLSSLWEGLPLTPIEAFSVGKTVIGTSVDGTLEIIRDGVDGSLVEARNSAQLAEKMNYLIDNPEIRGKFETQAEKRYQDEFSFEKLEQNYLDFYEGL
ncbi:glycosyltransferase family 4 protein [Streptococcus suis]|nr:glycosyltransferase family 4 protein [Streptococcus suis]